ncbi:immunoglobulin-like domain-containing protein [Domibacillus sp.]|uniref:immunoglobulin-like domain-containing protein n=1 Tax=Domibacillus sp. TaxID=1969783 RepID=UPI0028125694|nr:immunoglobulin-like domain-containing protein [Domibacillus sp.]
MNKRLVHIAACAMLLSACQLGEPEPEPAAEKAAPMQEMAAQKSGLSLTVQNVSDSSLRLMIQNGRNNDFTYGRAFRIEQQLDGAWYAVPFQKNRDAFEEIALLAPPRKQTIETVDLGRLQKPLEAGKYRIVKAFRSFSIDENGRSVYGTEFWLAAPFQIGN